MRGQKVLQDFCLKNFLENVQGSSLPFGVPAALSTFYFVFFVFLMSDLLDCKLYVTVFIATAFF